MDYLFDIVKALAGLALFVLGMQIMGDGLQKVAGEKLRDILRRLTSKPIYGVGVGAFITAIIQSSSATTVMVVGFVNAGIMTFSHAVGVIFGANIGTTITAQLVTLDFMDWAIWLSIAIGVALRMFGSRKQIRFIGEVLLGFGILFLGMDIMKDAFIFIKKDVGIQMFLADLSAVPILGVLAGAVFTAIIQSSSATTGVVIALSAMGVPGFNFTGAIALIIGANIGTCVTAYIASLNTSNRGAKKVALAHVLFNVLGAVIFLLLLTPTSNLIAMTSTELKRQVANYHTFFNISMTVLILPFTGLFIKLINKIMPESEKDHEDGIRFITDNLLATPSFALAQVTQELTRMLDIARNMVDTTRMMISSKKAKIMHDVMQSERTVNTLQNKITVFLAKLTQKSLSLDQAERSISLLHVVHDIERIGDHATNIAELAEGYIDHRVEFTKDGEAELMELFALTDKACKIANDALENYDTSLISGMNKLEQEIDDRTEEIREKHFERIKLEQCKPESGVYYLDIASNLERVGDHCTNITYSLLGIKKSENKTPDEERHRESS